MWPPAQPAAAGAAVTQHGVTKVRRDRNRNSGKHSVHVCKNAGNKHGAVIGPQVHDEVPRSAGFDSYCLISEPLSLAPAKKKLLEMFVYYYYYYLFGFVLFVLTEHVNIDDEILGF